MIEYQIDSLRKELDYLIEQGASFQEIYSMSITLDELIVAFYTQALTRK